MSDETRRDLQRHADTDVDKHRSRLEALRYGVYNPEPGDIVVIEETYDKWIHGEWVGVIRKRFESGDKYVSPLGENQDFRIRPAPRYLEEGLYLTRDDKMEWTGRIA